MENNKMVNDKNEACEKGHCCKHHRCIAIALMVLVVLGAFGIGLAIGHEGGRERGREGRRFDDHDFEGKGFFKSDKNEANENEAKDNNSKEVEENATSTNATSTVTK